MSRPDAFAAGADAWPDLALSERRFNDYLAQLELPPHAAHGADLYLVCGCLQGLPAALRAFEASFIRQIPRYVSRFRLAPDVVDELCQLLREKLLVGAQPKLREYQGKGKLSSWLRVVSARAAIDLMRLRDAEAQAPPADLWTAPPSRTPETQALQRRYRAHFDAAVAGGLRALSRDQRRLLRWHFVDGLSLETIGRRSAVHRSTVMRRLAAVTDALLAHVREQLRAELGLTSGELESLSALLQSDLTLSLSEQLKTTR